jgi:hypothetical protein
VPCCLKQTASGITTCCQGALLVQRSEQFIHFLCR